MNEGEGGGDKGLRHEGGTEKGRGGGKIREKLQ